MLSRLERFAVSIVLSLVAASSARAADPALSAEDGWKRLSLREKIGQTVILSSDVEAETKAAQDIGTYIAGQTGGLFARRKLPCGQAGGVPEDQSKLLHDHLHQLQRRGEGQVLVQR